MEFAIPAGYIALLTLILTFLYRPLKKDFEKSKVVIGKHETNIAVLKQMAKDTKEDIGEIKGNVGKIFDKIDEVNDKIGKIK